MLKVCAAAADLQEASLLASLAHPQVPRVLATGRTDAGAAWLLREHVDGVPLTQDLPLPPAAVLELAAQLLEILAYVHRRGVLHLDLKPGNVLRRGPADAPEYVVLDFGLGARDRTHTRAGTPFFAAPEVLLGLEVDARSDLFSLGALLFVALRTAAQPLPLARFLEHFPREDFFTAAGADPRDLPAPFASFLPRLLATEPGRRFADAEQALETLRSGGRPRLAQLALDPIACYGRAVAQALSGGDHDLELVEGTAAERQALAIHASTLASVRKIAATPQGLRIARGGGRCVRLRLPALGATELTRHLRTVLGLEAERAESAARQLLARGAVTTGAATALLEALAMRGGIVADGARWTWPDAEAGRELAPGPTEALPADPAGIAALAARGRTLQAEAAFAAAAASAPPAQVRALRHALATGLLAGGEPEKALAHCADIPALRVRALLDAGRAGAAERAMGSVDAGAPAADRARLELRLLQARGDLPAAERVARDLVAGLGEPADQVALAAVLIGRALPTPACAVLREALDRLGAEHFPYLRAAALTNLGEALRQVGDREQAVGCLQEAAQLFARLGHARHVASVQQNLGVIAKDLGRLEEAVACQRRARSLYLHVGDARGAALARANLGIVHLAAGDPHHALQELQAAEQELVVIGAEGALPAVRSALARAQASPHDPVPMEDRPDATGVPRAVFRTFLAVNRRLALEADLPRAMQTLLDAAVNLTGARNGYLLVVRRDGPRLEFRSGDAGEQVVALSRSLVNRSLQLRRTLTSADAVADKQLLEMPSVRDLRSRSAVCVPFVSASGAEGALYVDHPGRAGVFGDSEKEHLEILGDQAAIAVDRMLQQERVQQELSENKKELQVVKRKLRQEPVRMLGRSRPMQELQRQMERVAGRDLAVLVLGATVTGKELVARRLHELSTRARGPFVSENCSAIPSELIESELFGHTKGAFTGADQDRMGLFELASGGTLFLDEVGDLPLALQPKLLRALQEGRIRRVGGKQEIPIDLRLVAATHKDLRQLASAGQFREDLYFRLAAVEIRVPALAERGDDILLLAEEFLARLNRQHHKALAFSAGAKDVLRRYPWPGNVRELEHVIARAFLLEDGEVLSEQHLPVTSAGAGAGAGGGAGASAAGSWPVLTLAEAEVRTIRAALQSTGGDKTKAAKVLGISRTALYEKLKRSERR